jgi:cytoskeletal protein CcmA (bactofilin family)
LSEPSATQPLAGIPTVLESGTRFEGLVAFRGVVRVDGLVLGHVIADGTLILGPQGELRGRIEADRVTVEGTCEGEIEARERIELRPTARVRGRITAPCVVIADGSLLDGHCEAGRVRPAEAPDEVLRPSEPMARSSAEAASISA